MDPITAAGIDNLIVKLKKAFHMTIVVVTHEMASAFAIADRIAVMDRGEVIEVGTLDQIRASRQPQVIRFLNRVADDDQRRDSEAYLRSLTQS